MTTAAARGFRCAAASADRSEPLAGTASTVRAFLLVEHPGPWGVQVLRDSGLAPALRRQLSRRSAASGVRVLLVRRPGRAAGAAGAAGTRVFAARCDAGASWVESGVLEDPAAVLGLDLEGLGRGRSTGLPAHDGPLLCVCTHGRHDVCCAERGRPVAAALAAAYPAATWECSHIGGDRFAANLLVLPQGLYYGRLDPGTAVEVARGHAAGRLALDHLRGRTAYPMPVQAAEVALRRHLAEPALDALGLVEHARDGDLTRATFAVDARSFTVTVRSSPGGPERLTCGTAASRPPAHQTTEIVQAGGCAAVEQGR